MANRLISFWASLSRAQNYAHMHIFTQEVLTLLEVIVDTQGVFRNAFQTGRQTLLEVHMAQFRVIKALVEVLVEVKNVFRLCLA